MATTTTTKKPSTTTAPKTVEVPKVKKYDNEDLIPCKSMTNGGLYVEGQRSGFLYTWADYDDVVDVEYRDLNHMVRSKDKAVYEPRFIILDEEFVSQYKDLNELYNSLYSNQDLRAILDKPVPQMVKIIETLPDGVKTTLRGIAATMIDEHSLDSIKKIKALDEIFGTNLMFTLVNE